MLDKNKEDQSSEQTVKLEDLPMSEDTQDDVKGGARGLAVGRGNGGGN